MYKLACITCFYNFYECPLQSYNLHQFIDHINTFNIPVYGVELLMPGQVSITHKYNTWKQITGTESNILWQKEALLNLAEKLVPQEYTALAWIDADIIFDNKNWLEDLYMHLDFCDFVQLFTQAHWLDPDKNIYQSASSVVNYNPTVWGGHTGFAWSCKRDTWRRIDGLYERCISGGGDRIIAASITNKIGAVYGILHSYIGKNTEVFFKWFQLVKNSSVCNIPGDVYHLFHGVQEGRQYSDRKQYTHLLDAYKDVEKNDSGLLSWREDIDREIIEHFKNYFIKRQNYNLDLLNT